jgi:DNA-binding transcriptional ArsR family regulator
MLKQTQQRPDHDVDDVFRALGDPTRRSIVERLSLGPATVSELAHPLEITLSAVVQQLAILEGCHLVISEKIGRSRTCRLEPLGLRLAEDWFAGQRAAWDRRLDRLGEFLADEDAAVRTVQQQLREQQQKRQQKRQQKQPSDQRKRSTTR